ncbi:MAG: D-inositol-3-phosphate glycosyltransferase [Streptosporangiales bacterium]|nr:D-inositol-3-phosphate glycosyltransferase [Streptosporangiales bacterium]
MLSVHTSPLDGPGNGDAGGMNVYVLEVAKRLAVAGVEVEIFTRATSSELPPRVDVAPGVTVNHLLAGPYEGLAKEDLAGQLCAFTVGVLRAEARQRPGHYDLVHSHYWLSGQVGWVAKERWRVPLVHSMHTMARVKNLSLADGDRPEPAAREIGESQVVAAADRLVGNTTDETDQLVRLYDADPWRTSVVHPGVDLDVFRPGSAAAARRALGLERDAIVLLFAGRVQPLKGPDVVVDAAAQLLAERPQLRDRLVVAVVGGPSGTGTGQLDDLVRQARARGIGDAVRFVPAVAPARLADWYRAATATLVPSHSESFGLVALESQACGTPVVAARVGGLPTAVADGRTGVLVDGHDPRHYAAPVADLVDRADRREAMAWAAVRHAAAFSWDATAEALLDAYRDTIGAFTADVQGLSA